MSFIFRLSSLRRPRTRRTDRRMSIPRYRPLPVLQQWSPPYRLVAPYPECPEFPEYQALAWGAWSEAWRPPVFPDCPASPGYPAFPECPAFPGSLVCPPTWVPCPHNICLLSKSYSAANRTLKWRRWRVSRRHSARSRRRSYASIRHSLRCWFSSNRQLASQWCYLQVS